MSGRFAPVSLLVLAGLVATVSIAAAPRQAAFPDVCKIVLTFPSPTLEAMKIMQAEGGTPWDLIRRQGLSLTVGGETDLSVSLVGIAVSRGRVARIWASPSRARLRTGTVALSGREFLPDDRFLEGIPNALGEQAGTTVSIGEARTAIDARSILPLLDSRTAASASGVVLIAIPDETSRLSPSSTTTARFVRTAAFD